LHVCKFTKVKFPTSRVLLKFREQPMASGLEFKCREATESACRCDRHYRIPVQLDVRPSGDSTEGRPLQVLTFHSLSFRK
jgi:hypothetical protein